MAEYKNQHYVPQLLLRKFTTDNINVQTYVLKINKLIEKADIKSQCSEDYFYGSDGEIEKAFGVLEGQVGKLLDDIRPVSVEALTDEEVHQIRLFVLYQYQRTLHAAEDRNRELNLMIRNIFEGDSRFEDVNWDIIKAKLNQPQLVNLQVAAGIMPVILDLDIRILVNEKKDDFIISDNPVVLHNQFIEHHEIFRNYPAGAGLATKGALLFLPVSPKAQVMFYDPTTYFVGKKRLLGLSKTDVLTLNRLQMINAFECVYCLDINSVGINIEKESRNHARMKEKYSSKVYKSKLLNKPGTEKSELLMLRHPRVKIDKKLGFLKVIDKQSYAGYNRGILPIRSPEHIELAEKYTEYLKHIKKEKMNNKEK